MIYDADEEVYQVPPTIIFRPPHHHDNQHEISILRFDFEPEPFSFRILRGDNVLFDTSETNLIFQSQYLNLRTWLPDNPHLYGLGEHIDSLQLPTKNYTRTLWSRDSYGLPEFENLYGNHPIYVDHRGDSGTHGVFLLNSNGMDIKIDQTDEGRQYLEYNTLGGVLDFYFVAGPTPKDVSKQYAGVVGLPAMQSYWSFGVCNSADLIVSEGFDFILTRRLVPQLPIRIPGYLRSRRGCLQLQPCSHPPGDHVDGYRLYGWPSCLHSGPRAIPAG